MGERYVGAREKRARGHRNGGYGKSCADGASVSAGMDAAVRFERLYYGIAEPLYIEDKGRWSIGPVVLFKLVLLQHLDGKDF